MTALSDLTKYSLTLVVLLNPSHAWLLPVSSPGMSLPILTESSWAGTSSASINATPPPPPPPLRSNMQALPASSVLMEETSLTMKEASVITKDKTMSASSSLAKSKEFKVFCDLDGVLVDFEHGVRRLLPSDLETLPQLADLEKSTLWKTVRSADSFFEHLPWTNEGKHLWQAIQHLQPDILTGVPIHPSSRNEKFQWCQRELGVICEHVDMACPWTHGHRPVRRTNDISTVVRDEVDLCRVITCWSSNKHFESGPGHVLIDDRLALKHDWERKDGIFIHHETGNIEGTLQQLKEHGILN